MQDQCRLKFKDADVKQFAPEELFNKYKLFLKNIKIELDKNLKWCPKPECNTAIEKASQTCNTCGTVICWECGLPKHKGISC